MPVARSDDRRALVARDGLPRVAGPDLWIVLGCQLPVSVATCSTTFNTRRGVGMTEGSGATPATVLINALRRNTYACL